MIAAPVTGQLVQPAVPSLLPEQVLLIPSCCWEWSDSRSVSFLPVLEVPHCLRKCSSHPVKHSDGAVELDGRPVQVRAVRSQQRELLKQLRVPSGPAQGVDDDELFVQCW